MSPSPNPALVEVWRGEQIESAHRGAVAIVDGDGALVWSTGDIDALVYPRSALKILQALPLIESGAADAFVVTPSELALACASHTGQKFHVAAVEALLERLDADQSCLACGAHMPIDAQASHELIRAGAAPSSLHNTCSGKHAGFIAVARQIGVDHLGYEGAHHPVQRLVLAAIADMAGLSASSMRLGVDGCTAPAPLMPLRSLANAMAKIAVPSTLAPLRAHAATRLNDAIKSHPLYMAGEGRSCSRLIQAAKGSASVKIGTEGVYTAVLSHLGLGLALKIDDGGARAAECAMARLLVALGAIDPSDPDAVSLSEQPVLDTCGRLVGKIAPTAALGVDSLRSAVGLGAL